MNSDNSRTSKTKPFVLLVDDVPKNLQILGNIFDLNECRISLANSGEQALRLVEKEKPDLIILDILMPGMDGFEVCQRLKQNSETYDIPIIFITAKNQHEDITKGFEAGAVDYITKPFSSSELLARANTHLELKKSRDKILEINASLESRVKIRTEALKKSERKYSTVIEIMPQGLVEFDLEGNIHICNRAFHTMLKYPNGSLQGKNLYPLLSGSFHQNNTPISIQTLFQTHTKPLPVCGKVKTHEGNIIDIQIEWDFKTDKQHEPVGIVAVVSDITERIREETLLREREQTLKKENCLLKSGIKERYRFGNIVGKSMAIQHVYELISQAAATDASTIIYGKSGTGKELVAQAIHHTSDRKNKQFITINCGALPENLFESEFFGYKKGAFTGAYKDKKGVFDLAEGGTLFLDEIGEMPLTTQVKLLRVIEGGGYTPVGGDEIKYHTARIISATNRNLKELVRKGEFREDLFYRIHVIPIHLPSLNERKEDIPLLIEHFQTMYSHDDSPEITGTVLDALKQHTWPGNVRELQNVLQRFFTVKQIDISDLPSSCPHEFYQDVEGGFDDGAYDLRTAVEKIEKLIIERALEKFKWKKGVIALKLGIDPKTLSKKMKDLNIVA